MTLKRIDRTLTIYIFNHIARLFRRNRQIPVLMYHNVSNKEKKWSHPYYDTNTRPDIFIRQMTFLKRNNYQIIDIDKALKIIRNSGYVKERYAVITFDDGYQDNLTNALPVLKEFDFTATVYLATNYINEQSKQFKDHKCLNWKEVIELQDNNIEIGSHTVSHPQLSTLTHKEVETEIQKSKEIIENKLGKPCTSFSYPYAFPEEDKKFVVFLRNVLLESGYHNSVSTILGTLNKKSDNYFIRRIPVNSGDDESFFRAKLEGGYNWIHFPQFLNKKIKYILQKY